MSRASGDLLARVEVAVLGGGAAGIAAAAALKRRHIASTIFEFRSVGASWRARYEGLRLNTVRWMSGLPGRGIPRNAGSWPGREDFVRYLESYARTEGLTVNEGVHIDRVDLSDDEIGGFLLSTSAGPILADHVVVALGLDRVPKWPSWPGRDLYRGTLIHSSEYRSAKHFAGRDVLVIGAGNSGCEIAAQLVEAGAGRVRLSVRGGPNILRRNILGVPSTVLAAVSTLAPDALTDRVGFALQRLLWGDLRRYGLPRAQFGVATEVKVKGGPTIDSGFVRHLKQHRVTVVPAVDSFDDTSIVLVDASRLAPDVAIAATGFHPSLEPLVGHLGVLNPWGFPIVTGGQTVPWAPGLYFNGYRVNLAGPLPLMRRTSAQIARAISHAGRSRATVPSGHRATPCAALSGRRNEESELAHARERPDVAHPCRSAAWSSAGFEGG